MIFGFWTLLSCWYFGKKSFIYNSKCSYCSVIYSYWVHFVKPLNKDLLTYMHYRSASCDPQIIYFCKVKAKVKVHVASPQCRNTLLLLLNYNYWCINMFVKLMSQLETMELILFTLNAVLKIVCLEYNKYNLNYFTFCWAVYECNSGNQSLMITLDFVFLIIFWKITSNNTFQINVVEWKLQYLCLKCKEVKILSSKKWKKKN